uniref:bL27m n=1 Tax=Polytomella magna TaxID=353565 RepID=UPI002240E46C|nr:Chain Au, bL27m [Polytomella magna]8APN_Au Chain Au, bL27m [Polytomella magna]8APO_Au Chain Au, bL27m [Polytomella magna]
QGGKSHAKNWGPKFGDGEIVFPGMIIMRQKQGIYSPGYNVGRGRDYTIFAKTVGYVEYSKLKTERGKTRRYIHVVPINDDWSPEYQKLADELVVRRAEVKRQILGHHVHTEPAFHFSLPQRNGNMSWLLNSVHKFPGTTTLA